MFPILDFRCSRWPPQATVAAELDTLQKKMVGTLLRLTPLPEDAAPTSRVPRIKELPACTSGCSGHGQCQPARGSSHADSWTARCACRPGWSGERCEIRDASPCNTPEGGRVLTRCAGSCDEDINRCSCGPQSRFPLRSMMHCRYEGVEHDMAWQTPAWANFASAPRSAFWSNTSAHVRGAVLSRSAAR